VFRADSGRTNGNTFDAQGRLISCEGAEFGPGGRRRVVRTDVETGAVEVIADRFEGKRFNAPNDVCVDRRGRVWFTDPYYWTDRDSLEMGAEAVYCLDGSDLRRVVSQPQIERPNGLAITPDDKTLYVVDNHNVAGGNRKIWAFDVGADCQLANQRLVYDFGHGRGADGMRLDREGNLWVAAGVNKARGPHESGDVPAGVYVITPQGKLLGSTPIPEDTVTNLAFGGPDFKTLFVTAGKTVFKLQVAVAGYSLFPAV
jgi:gluconolactonase